MGEQTCRASRRKLSQPPFPIPPFSCTHTSLARPTRIGRLGAPRSRRRNLHQDEHSPGASCLRERQFPLGPHVQSMVACTHRRRLFWRRGCVTADGAALGIGSDVGGRIRIPAGYFGILSPGVVWHVGAPSVSASCVVVTLGAGRAAAVICVPWLLLSPLSCFSIVRLVSLSNVARSDSRLCGLTCLSQGRIGNSGGASQGRS